MTAARRPVVHVSRELLPRVMEALHESFDVTFQPDDETHSRERQLAALAAGADGFLAMVNDHVDAVLLDAAGPRLRAVANFGVGYDNVDVPACTRRGIVASNTPGVLVEATAEIAIGIMLALGRRIAEGDRLLRAGTAWRWSPSFMLGWGLEGKRLGIVGLGQIGSRVAELAVAHRMEVVHASRSDRPGCPYPRLPLDELLATSDVVSLHCPLGAETRHLIGPRELRLMRRSAVLVNTARGPVVDEAALVEALREGVIAGAGLDVFEEEPKVHPGLLPLENVVLVPHLGSATDEVRTAMGLSAVSALQAVLLDERLPPNALNDVPVPRPGGAPDR